MIMCPPPYRPLRGAEPPHYAERDDEDELGRAGIATGCLSACARGPADPRFHRLIYGGPAMGKTAVLRAVSRRAQSELGWAVARYRCTQKQSLSAALHRAVSDAVGHQWPDDVVVRLAGLAAHPSFAPTDRRPRLYAVTTGERPWAGVAQLLRAAGRYCQTISSGLLVVVDDADRARAADFEALGHVARCLAGEGLPVAVLVSGTAALADRARQGGNFAGTIWLTRLLPLSEPEAREALVVPAADRGVDFEPEAVEALWPACAGSPLELQRLGFAAWSLASSPTVVTAHDARRALSITTQPDLQAS